MRVLFSKKLIFVAKPRCASTSVRRALDSLVNEKAGDISVDIAGQKPPYHPHLSAPYIKELLQMDGHDISGMETIIVTRNPIAMLWSYFNFFQPDTSNRYNYQNDWEKDSLMQFIPWLINGRVGMHPRMNELSPKWVSTDDFSPLSLEAHIMDRNSNQCVDHIFFAEKLQDLAEYLFVKTSTKIVLPKLNSSQADIIPSIPDIAKNRIRKCFPLESKIYSI